MSVSKLPKWFNGTKYDEGAEVKNPFSGETYTLSNVELSMYDFIMGAQMVIEMKGGLMSPLTASIQNDMAKGLSWFRKHNAKAYMVLLD